MKETAHLTISILANALQDLTADFCDRFLSKKFRTYGWIIGAAHTAQARVNESYLQGTSLTGYLKLLESATVSFQELKAHFENFLSARELPLYEPDDQKSLVFRQFHVFILQGEGTARGAVANFIDGNDATDYANLLRTLTQKELSLLSEQTTSYREKLAQTSVPALRPRRVRKPVFV